MTTSDIPHTETSETSRTDKDDTSTCWRSVCGRSAPELKAEARFLLPLFIKSAVAAIGAGLAMKLVLRRSCALATMFAAGVALGPVIAKETCRIIKNETADLPD